MKKANVAFFVPNVGCPHKCSFCDQREISGHAVAPSPSDVEKTAKSALLQLGERAAQSEIAFFGGSFTAIEPDYILSLLKAAYPYVGKNRFKGIRVSTRPDAIDEDILITLKRYGVTAVELGAQSMDDDVLALNRRGHTSRDVEKASGLIKAYGFELGLQMMTGLYGSDRRKDADTARAIAALTPDTVRVYPTIVLKNTLLAHLFDEGKYTPPSLEETVTLCAELLEFFHDRHIAVIRLGLHASKSIEENYKAGPWHPAFRELCESSIYLKKAEEAIEKLCGKCRRAVLYAPNGALSKLAGQHRKNIIKLEADYNIKLKISERDLPKYTVSAEIAD